MVVYIAVQNEADLLPHYTEPLLCIPTFKAILSFSLFVLLQRENGVVIGQLLPCDAVASNILVSVFLPLYDTGTRQHINCDDILDPQLDQGFSGGFRVLRLLTFR